MGERREKVRQHQISGLTVNKRMNWLEHIKNTKARVEKKINIMKWEADKGSGITLNNGKEAYGLATKAVLKKLEPTHNRGIRLALGVFTVNRTKNVLCEAG
jgi:hypothetical protein